VCDCQYVLVMWLHLSGHVTSLFLLNLILWVYLYFGFCSWNQWYIYIYIFWSSSNFMFSCSPEKKMNKILKNWTKLLNFWLPNLMYNPLSSGLKSHYFVKDIHAILYLSCYMSCDMVAILYLSWYFLKDVDKCLAIIISVL
jgi:hypothetical protein